MSFNNAGYHIRCELQDLYPPREINALASIIIKHVTGNSKVNILANPDKPITPDQWVKINKICVELKQFKPIQYILGQTEFYGLVFKVNKHTLIPRQETEELVELIIKENKKTSLRIIDIGTGCGCIAITLAFHLNNPRVLALDKSKEALKLTEENSNLNKVQVELIHEDIFNDIADRFSEFDLIISNPPYVLENEKKNMSPLVIDNEPYEALFVPDDNPLKYYRAILIFAEQSLKKDGRVYFEINEAKGPEMKDLLSDFGYRDIRLIKDINGKDRIISGINYGK